MASELDSKGTEGFRCAECPEEMSHADVQRAASAATFEAYDKLATRTALASLPDFAWCLGPGCRSGQLNTDNSDFMECAACGYKQCLRHGAAWHAGETCEQHDRRTSGAAARREEEEARTAAVLDAVSKPCPGAGCGWRIQKADGCDHMTCRKCRHEFCWRCLAAQAEIRRVGNAAHARDCRFHSDNLAVAWPFNMH